MHKPNNLLAKDVRDQLDWDPLIDNTRIVVKADDGLVTLTGSVPTYYETLLAPDDAWSVHGVKAVDNGLLVGLVGDAITDAEIAAACATALDADRFVPKEAVSAEVTEGWVTLSGEVRRHFQRRSAEHAVRRIDGVLGITNKIAITSDPVPSDVADRINRAFRRNAIIDDSMITVTNSGNTVFLDGTAGSWRAKMEAEDASWEAPGVSDVIDRLVIVP